MNTPDEEPTFVDKPQAAEMVGVSVRTLERLVAAGQFPPPIQFGRRRRWLRKGLSRWIEGGCKPTRQA
jgi:excisionase family DNA binding protein